MNGKYKVFFSTNLNLYSSIHHRLTASMEAHYKTIRSTLTFSKYILGVELIGEWRGKFYVLFQIFNIIFGEICMFYSFFIEENIKLKFYLGIIAVGCMFPMLVFFNNVFAIQKYEECIDFCENLSKNPNINECKSIAKYSKIFRKSVMVMPSLCGGFYIIFLHLRGLLLVKL